MRLSLTSDAISCDATFPRSSNASALAPVVADVASTICISNGLRVTIGMTLHEMQQHVHRYLVRKFPVSAVLRALCSMAACSRS